MLTEELRSLEEVVDQGRSGSESAASTSAATSSASTPLMEAKPKPTPNPGRTIQANLSPRCSSARGINPESAVLASV